MQIFRLSTARIKINQIPYVSFPLNFKSAFSVMTHSKPIKVQFFRLLGALMKVHPIPHAINPQGLGLFNFALLFSVMKGNSSVFL